MATRNKSAVSDEEIIAALIASGTITTAAESLSISPRTVYDRMSKTEFQTAYSSAKADILRSAVFAINGKVTEAIETVSAIMADENTNPAIRLQAAQTILNAAGKFADRLQQQETRTESIKYSPF